MNSRFSDYRHTKIIVTLGPATESAEMIRQLILNGADMVRLNMAHGSVEWADEMIDRIRQVGAEANRQIAVMMDVKGPEIRTGEVATPIDLASGDRVRLVTETVAASERERRQEPFAGHVITVNYADLPSAVPVDSIIVVDSGLLRWRVVATHADWVDCEVITPGTLGSRRHINLPGIEVNLPALSEKDKTDLIGGIKSGIDFVALSFVRRAEDIEELRLFLTENGSNARIIAKIEEQAGVRNMVAIIKASDAVLVARGDLGIEIHMPSLPLVQTEMVQACKAEGKPVIIATHLLESMIETPTPTRAEISDVCNAVREQADAVMLSGETTIGMYPIEALKMMSEICRTIEPTVSLELNDKIVLRKPKAKMLRSAATLAQELEREPGQHSGIVVFTRSGFLAYVLGALRPRGVPIFAFTDIEETFRHTLLPWGVEPFLIEFSDDPEKTISDALAMLRETNWCDAGASMVVITNALADDQVIDAMQLRQV